MTARDRLVAALGGLELMPGSILRLTGRAAERIADLALDVLGGPAEPLRPAAEVALDLAVLTGVHEQSAAARALVGQVEAIRRQAIEVAYAEGREDRDELRRERDDARRVLAELLQACDVLRTRATPTTVRAHREHVDEARRYLDRVT